MGGGKIQEKKHKYKKGWKSGQKHFLFEKLFRMSFNSEDFIKNAFDS